MIKFLTTTLGIKIGSIVIGVLVLVNVVPAAKLSIDKSRIPAVQHYYQTKASIASFASFWDQGKQGWIDELSALIQPPPVNTIIYVTKDEFIPNNNIVNNNISPVTIIRESISNLQIQEFRALLSDSPDITSLKQEISNLKQDLASYQRITPTTLVLPPTNTTGIGPITSNPDTVSTGTLTVTGGSTLSGLSLSSDLTVDTSVFKVDTVNNRVGINTSSPETSFEVVGTASISTLTVSSATTLGGIAYTWPSTQTSNKFLMTDGSGTLSWSTAGVSSNSLDFDEIVNSMTLDSNLTINRGSGYFIGLGSAPSTVFEVQGTASASYLLTGNTLQVGGYSSAAYSRFGTSTISGPASNWITQANDILVSGDLYGVGSLAFQGPASLSNTLWVSPGGSGNVGIGTTTPNSLLHLYSSGITEQRITGSASGLGSTIASMSFYNGSTKVAVISATVGNASTRGNLLFRNFDLSWHDTLFLQEDGKVGLGTTDPTMKIHIFGPNALPDTSGSAANNGILRLDPSGASNYVLDFGVMNTIDAGWIQARTKTNYSSNIYLILNPNGGNVGIGTTTPSTNKLQVTGSAGKTVGGTAWQDLSDARLKNVLSNLNGTSLETLMKLRPIKYEWNDLHKELYGNGNDTQMYGFLAQELKEVIPQMVTVGGDGYFWYNPSGIEAILTAGIQEQQSQIASLSFHIEDLEARMASQSQDYGLGTNTVNSSLIFNAVITMFKDAFDIVFEKGLVKVAQVITDKITAKEICLEEVCVNKAQLKELLEKNGMTPTSGPESTSIPEPAPESTPEITPEPTPEIMPEPTPEATPELTPEPTPEATPEPTLEPTPEPEPGI